MHSGITRVENTHTLYLPNINLLRLLLTPDSSFPPLLLHRLKNLIVVKLAVGLDGSQGTKGFFARIGGNEGEEVKQDMGGEIALVALKNLLDAQSSYEQVIVLDKTNAHAWTGLGLVLAQMRQVPKAIQALQTAVSLNPQQAIAQQALKVLMETQPKPQGEGVGSGK